jgi:hypothetical protein
VKKYRNPNIPKPTPGSDTGKEPRYKTQPVKPEPTPKPKPKPKKAIGPVKKKPITGPKVDMNRKLSSVVSPRRQYLLNQAKKRQQNNRTLALPVPPMKSK